MNRALHQAEILDSINSAYSSISSTTGLLAAYDFEAIVSGTIPDMHPGGGVRNLTVMGTGAEIAAQVDDRYVIASTGAVTIGNMMIGDKESRSPAGLVLGGEVHASNLVIENCDIGIWTYEAGRNYVLSNNTIANCGEGITILYAEDPERWGVEEYKRRDYYAAVENNIVYKYETHGIRVGIQDVASVITARGWNTSGESLGVGEPGNEIFPISYNVVWSILDPTGNMAFVGDEWYSLQSVRQGELFVDPNLDTLLAPDPTSVGSSPIIEAGNPYRIDLTRSGLNPYEFVVSRRTIGALRLPTTINTIHSLALEDE